MMFAARAVLSALLFPVLLSAAGTVDGNWIGRSDADDPELRPLQLFVKAEGTALTGKLNNAVGWYQIENGSVVGEQVSFDAVTPVEGGASVIEFTCTGPLVEETIDLSCQMGDGSVKKYLLKPNTGA